MSVSTTSTRAAVATALSLLALTGCGSERTEESRAFPFSGRALTVEAGETDLVVERGGSGAVGVRRILNGAATRPGSSEWALRDGTLELRTACVGIVLNCGSRHTVRIPDGVTVKIAASGGAVRVRDLKQDLTAVLSNDASLRVENPVGTLRLTNGGGRIVVTGARSPDVRAVTTADGNIRLSFAAAPRRVEARAAGSVAIDLPAGPETYRVDAPGNQDVSHDPRSPRLVKARASDGGIALRKGG